MARHWDGRLIMVSDSLPNIMPVSTFDRSIDQPTTYVLEELLDAAKEFCREIVLLKSPTELANRHQEFIESLIFPYWFGQKQRSRHAYIPALCEACGLMFVGADAFTKTVCNDKELSKAICRIAGLSVPSSVVVVNRDDLDLCSKLDYPVFVKPNFEGTSLGIDEKNICTTPEEVRVIANQIRNALRQPVLVEEYIEGTEISAAFLIGRDRILHGASCLLLGEKPFRGIYDWRMKHSDDITLKPYNISNNTFWKRANKALSYFEKTGMFRIDCRIKGDEPIIIELTPDIYMGSDGEFVTALTDVCPTYLDVIGNIIRDSLEWYGAEMPMSN